MGGEVFLMYILRHFAYKAILDFSNPHWYHVNRIYSPQFQPSPFNIPASCNQLSDGSHEIMVSSTRVL